MSVTIGQSERQAMAFLRSFIQSVLGADTVEVIRGQNNRTPEPPTPDFVVMTPMLRERLETTVETYTDSGDGCTRTDLQPTKLTVQLDFHGPQGGNSVQVVSTLFRSSYATDFMEQLTALPGGAADITPLDHGDPRQTPFINAESQVEERWSLDVYLQINPVVTSVIQSATEVSVGIIEVDATYPP